jgi:hypothetical protein
MHKIPSDTALAGEYPALRKFVQSVLDETMIGVERTRCSTGPTWFIAFGPDARGRLVARARTSDGMSGGAWEVTIRRVRAGRVVA